MQKLFKKWFGDQSDITEELEIAVDRETRNVSCKKSKLESGATAIEYALIASLIAVAIIGATQALGTNVSDTFNAVSGQLQ